MFYTYHRDGAFCTTDDANLQGWSDRFDITDEQHALIIAGAAVSIVEGEIVVIPAAPRPPEPSVVPPFVLPAQIRQWLIDNDMDGAVDAAFENEAYWPSEKVRKKAKTRWEYELKVDRDDPLLNAVGQLLGLTSQQMDEAFIQAAEYY